MYYESELYHHGIKGQKWGVRRFQNADGTFNEAGKKRYFGNGAGENYHKLSNTNSSNKSEVKDFSNEGRKGLTDSQKKALKIGAAVAGTALVAYGAYKLNDKATKALMDSYKDVAEVHRLIGKDFQKTSEQYRGFVNESIRANQSLKIQKSLNDTANSYLNRGIWNTNEANRLDNIANSKFSSKEKAQAIKTIMTKGSDEFKRLKKKEIFDISTEKIQHKVDMYNLDQLISNAKYSEKFHY